MSNVVQNQRIRLPLNLTQWQNTPVDQITSSSPIIANGADLQFELAFSYGDLVSDDQLVSLSNWSSVTVALKDVNDRSGLPYWARIIPASSLNNSLTYATWQAGTAQHCVVPVPSAINQIFLTTNQQSFLLDISAMTASTNTQVTAIAVVAGGASYTANDVISVVGGTSSQLAAIIVDTVDGGGAILTAHIVQAGSYSAQPSNAVSVTGGTGSGATFNLTWARVPAQLIPLGVFPVSVVESGIVVVPPSTVTPTTYYTAAQCDARFMLTADLSAKANLSGATFTGAVILASGQMSGATGLYATTKTYVDAGDAAVAAASVPNTGVSTIAGAKTFSSLLTASSGLTVVGTTTLATSLGGVLKATAGVVAGSATTSDLTEGSNLYFTNARAIAATLTGYAATSGTVAATDTILQAIQKLGYSVANAFSGATVFTAANQTAMLALSSAKKGDFAFRTDTNVCYILGSGSYSLIGSWNLIPNPVSSVNGAIGVVVLTTDNVAEGSSNLYYTNTRADARITAARGVASGICPLDSSTFVPWANLPTLTGFSSSAGAVSSSDTILTAIGKLDANSKLATTAILTGYVSGAGTVASTDTVLAAIQKLNGNIVALGTGAALTGATFTGRVNFSGTSNHGLTVNQLTTSQIGSLAATSGYYGTIVYDTTANQLKALVNGSFVSISSQNALPLSAGSGSPLTGSLYFQDGLATNMNLGNVWSMRTSAANANFDIQASGSTILSVDSSNRVYIAGAGELHINGNKVIDGSSYYYDSGGHQILAAQQSAIPDFVAAGGWSDSTAYSDFGGLVSKTNAILAALRAHGLINT